MTGDEARAALSPALSEAVAALIAEDRDRERADDRDHRGQEWPEFMRVPTAARYIDSSVETARKLVARGVLRVVQEDRGHTVYVERAELDRLLRRWRR